MTTFPELPPPFHTSPPESFQLIARGAEALVYKTTFLTPTTPAALKVRPTKSWRHPTLDRRLTRQRVLAESRVLVRCAKEGIIVPKVYAVDGERAWLVSEWVEGKTIKQTIRDWPAHGGGEEEIKGLLRRIGEAVGRLHATGVVHGDLTTSNMMLRPTSTTRGTEPKGAGTRDLEGEIVLIDFGLALQNSGMEEDRAVDLYVLERAFGSTHPKEEKLFGEMLEAYGESYRGAKITLKKLEDVRMRGRKRSMVG